MKSSVGYDCVIIAGAEKATGAKLLGSNFCGRALASETSAAAGKDLKTVCSKYSLIRISSHAFYR